MSTETVERNIIVTPFAIEADHPRMSDLLIQSIPERYRLRSTIDGSKPGKNSKGEEATPIDQVTVLGSFPKTPGMQLYVNPEECTYKIVDPLNEDEKLCEKIRKWLKQNSGFNMGDKLEGNETIEGKLDTHRMKTLCREMFNLVESGEAKKITASFPNMEEIDELPGYFLLNPGSNISNSQPVYEKDFASWEEKLSRSGI